MLLRNMKEEISIVEGNGRNMLIFIPLGLLLGFIATCVILKYCKRPIVSDISLRINEDPHNDSIVDYSKLLLSP